MINQEKIKEAVVQDLTGLTYNDRRKVANGQTVSGIDILTLLQIAAIVTQILSIVIPWWNSRSNNLIARFYLFRETQKVLAKNNTPNIKGISAYSISNSIYNKLKDK